MASISLDEHTANTLTDEELAVINGDDAADDPEGMSSIDDGSDDADGSDDDDDGEGDGENDERGSEEESPVFSQEFKPSYQATLPEDFGARLAEVDAESSNLATKFREGEIDFDEYVAAVNAVNVRRDVLASAKIKAEIADEMREQEGEQRWRWTVNQFISRTAEDEKIDYRTDSAKVKDFDLFIKALAADEANSTQSAEWFLIEAHRRVKALHGIAKNQPAAIDQQEKPRSRKPDLKAVPNTLAHVPGSDGPGDVDNEFADIYALDGLEFESAIAKMSAAQRDKFARAG